MKKNINLMYIYGFLITFLLFRSCDTLYYLEKGISSSGYIIFLVITYIVSLAFQVPSGIIADKYSKKRILLLSNTLLLLSIILFIIANSFIFLAIAIIILALANTFQTGISNSIIYTSLEDKKRFNKVLFYRSIFTYSSYLLAMILGGYVGSKSLVNMYYISIIPVMLNYIIIVLLDDSSISARNETSKRLILKDAIKSVKENKIVISMFLSASMNIAVLTIMAESHPEYSNRLGISTFIIGIYTAIMCLFAIFGEAVSSKTKNRRKYLLFLPILTGINLLVIGIINNFYGIIFIILAQFLFSIYNNSMTATLHHNISSKSRVTVESLLSLLTSLFGIVLGLITSLILNYLNVNNTYIILGIITILYSFIVIIYSKDVFKTKNML